MTCNNGITPLLAQVTRLSSYVPPVAGAEEVRYWKRHLRADHGTFPITVTLDAPAEGGEELFYHFEGTAVAGVHYNLPVAYPLVLTAGQETITFPIQVLDPGVFFKEVKLDIVLEPSPTVEPVYSFTRASVWLRPTAVPPVIVPRVPLVSRGPGASALVPFDLSGPSLEDVTVNYTIQAGTLTDYTVSDSGSVVIPAGETVGIIDFSFGQTAVSDEEVTVQLDYERSTAAFDLHLLDGTLLADPHDRVVQTIHVDENLWTFSVGGLQELEYHTTSNPAPDDVMVPGTPTDTVAGGAGVTVPGTQPGQLIDQLNPTPLVDPFHDVPLRIFTISPTATGQPYVRKSFAASFTHGPRKLYTLKEFVRVSYYIRQPEDVDAVRKSELFRVGFRNRSLNLNHGATFQFDSAGTDKNGNSTTTYPTSFGTFGLWDTSSTTVATSEFGLEEDAFGIRAWFTHHLDGSTLWDSSTAPNPIPEMPDTHDGNPIEYPSALFPNYFSALGITNFAEVRGLGNMAYGFMWEMSAQPLTGPPGRYWPKAANWWEPVGNATIDPANSNQIIFRVQ